MATLPEEIIIVESTITEKEKEVTELQQAYDQAEEKYNQGAKGFYQWIIDTGKDSTGDAAQAIEILDQYTGPDGVQIGLAGDATDLAQVRRVSSI